MDGAGADTIYVGKLLPRANVTETREEKWTDGDDPVGYDVTLSANFDSESRTLTRFFCAGPGWNALLVDMGFAAS